MIALEQKKEFFQFINDRLNSDFEPEKSRCIAVTEGDKILGVFVASRFTSYSCELSLAADSPRFLSRKVMMILSHYLFVTCGIIRVTSIVKEHNHRSLKLTRGVGFIEEARLKKGGGDQDTILFRMLKEECKWIKHERC